MIDNLLFDYECLGESEWQFWLIGTMDFLKNI
jgi:hypothetical protein